MDQCLEEHVSTARLKHLISLICSFMLDTVANIDNIAQYNPFKRIITILRLKSSKNTFLSLKMIPWQYYFKKYFNGADCLVVSTMTCSFIPDSGSFASPAPPSLLCPMLSCQLSTVLSQIKA